MHAPRRPADDGADTDTAAWDREVQRLQDAVEGARRAARRAASTCTAADIAQARADMRES